MRYYVGLDIHSTNTYIGIIDEEGRRIHKGKRLNYTALILNELEPFQNGRPLMTPKTNETANNLMTRPLKGKTPAEKFSGKGRCLLRDFDLPRKLALADGYVHLVLFIRSNRVLDIFGEKFVMPSEVEYEYVWTTIDIKNEKLMIYHDSNLIKESLPKTALDLSEMEF